MKVKRLITKSKKQILLFLYTFRFINTNQFQKLFNHREPNHVQDYLLELKTDGYIDIWHKKVKEFGDRNKPFIYHLLPKSRKILKKEDGVETGVLNLIYKERSKGEKFVNHCMRLSDIYLFFLARKGKNEELKFFTKNKLAGYDYFPQPFPDAYISSKSKDKVRRYFLDLFDEYTPPFVYRRRIKEYLKYSASGAWALNTNKSPFPHILFVCPTEGAKKHVYWYGRSVIKKSFENISLSVTTIDTLKYIKDKENPWMRVK